MLASPSLSQPTDPSTIFFTGATSCFTCLPDCGFGYFQSVSCSLDRDRVCKPYQYSAPEGLKYFIACGQVALVGILTLMIYKLFLESLLLQLRSVSQISERWTMFYIFIGFWDFVSDITMLALIEPFNPYGLFWVSLGALAISVAASVLLASISEISTSWPVKVIIFIASCGSLFESEGSTQLCFNWSPGFFNHIVMLIIEQAPQLVVQCLLLYLQGIQGFSSLDWAIWCQSAAFTLLNAFKNIEKVLLSNKRTESAADSTDVQIELSSLAISGAGGLVTVAATA